jgi:hypothetical protein
MSVACVAKVPFVLELGRPRFSIWELRSERSESTGEEMAQLGTGVGSRMAWGKVKDANSGANVDSKSASLSAYVLIDIFIEGRRHTLSQFLDHKVRAC